MLAVTAHDPIYCCQAELSSLLSQLVVHCLGPATRGACKPALCVPVCCVQVEELQQLVLKVQPLAYKSRSAARFKKLEV